MAKLFNKLRRTRTLEVDGGVSSVPPAVAAGGAEDNELYCEATTRAPQQQRRSQRRQAPPRPESPDLAHRAHGHAHAKATRSNSVGHQPLDPTQTPLPQPPPECEVPGDRPLRYEPWFLGGLGRDEVMGLLFAEGATDGSFLVRSSQQAEGYVISVREGGEARHIRISQTPWGHFRIEPGREFSSVGQLVAFYRYTFNNFVNLAAPITREAAARAREERVDEWEVDPTCLTLLEVLGRGTFGDVKRAKWAKGMGEVAVKTFHQGAMTGEEFGREVGSMKRLRHPNLVKLYGVVSRGPTRMIIIELMTGGALNAYLASHEVGTAGLVEVLRKVAAGMGYLASQNVVHRDLSARNVLVGEHHLTVKIADFGLARILHNDIYERTTPMMLPFRWTSPEVFLYDQFSVKSDVWAYGVVVWEVFSSGTLPYPECRNKSQVFELLQTGSRLERPMSCPREVWKLALHCMEHYPTSRPDFPHILEFLTGWEEEEEREEPRQERSMGLFARFSKSNPPKGTLI